MSEIENPKQYIKDHLDDLLIFSCLSGSHAYGMATPASDLDVRGVFLLPERYRISPFHKVEQVEGEGDTVHYELGKFMYLLANQNPNILELLWVDDDCIHHETESWRVLRDRRQEILSRKIEHTFGGYALAQMKKMVSHRKWINNPQPKEAPVPRQFTSLKHDLTDDGRLKRGMPVREGHALVIVSGDNFLLYESPDHQWYDDKGALCTFGRSEFSTAMKGKDPIRPVAMVTFNRQEYRSAKQDWDNYWGWKRNRNSERGALEEKLGYDTKNASHLVRLLVTGRDALRDGALTVRRPDADFLLSIRRGELSYKEVIELAEGLKAELEEAAASTSLPDDVDREAMVDIMTEMYRRHQDYKVTPPRP